MDLLFYIISGILYCGIVLSEMFFLVLCLFFCIKLLFWVFDTLGVDNPFILIFRCLTKFIGD